ncbi:MAG: protein TolQ [Deltaproteobacteria bacterium]|nr:protein TolQ [Deltaproteobacteria bacterium]
MGVTDTFLLTTLIQAVSVDSAFGSDIIQMILHASLMVKIVMLILFVFSIASWTIIFMKWRLFRRAHQETLFFLDLFWENTEWSKIDIECDDLLYSPMAQLFRSGYSEIKRFRKIHTLPSSKDWSAAMQPLLDNVERSLKKTTIDQNSRMEKAIPFLATTGNTAPFIGLFGTVWGIMDSFRGIGMKGSANLAVVAPGISEALIATAAGLAAAIPAVVAFNHFNNKATVLRSEMDTFASDFMSLVGRQFYRIKVTSQENPIDPNKDRRIASDDE